MIRINLLPDVKQELIKAQRTRNVVVSVAIMAGVGSVAVVVVMALLVLAQVGLENRQKGIIKDKYNELSKTQNVSDLVTIQNQLSKVSSINASRTKDSRVFDVLSAINPAAPNNVKFTAVTIDPSTKSLSLEGTALGGYSALETLKKSILNAQLKATKNGTETTGQLASDVTIGDTRLGRDLTGAAVLSFQLKVTYADGLFDNSLTDASIVLPTGTVNVTDSRTRVPDSLFTTSGGTQ